MGGFGEYAVLPEDKCEKLDDAIDPKYALGEPQKCIITVVRGAKPEAGDYGVILGCGSMGLWCTQVLARNMLSGLIVVDVDEKKLALAKKFGASHTINPTTEDTEKRISEITSGHMADFAIEGTGIPAVLNAAQDYVRAGRGRLVLMSSHEDVSKEFDFRKSIDRGLDIIVAHPLHADNQDDEFRRAAALINNGTFRTKELVTHEFALSDITTAFNTLANKPDGFLKGIVCPR